ncbi:MAG: tRNA glutamyl-Q(34) synthetase GluQRS [Rhodospirillaceae bacterium]|nr:tRNA glutamyl-Q(34) synthetase GluQRS [Rhodospirillaceae bacterium]
MDVITRFAPSPTGNLHLGHAFSALFAEREARTGNGKFLVRIEDIDTARCNSAFEASIFEDLSWLSLTWEKPVRKQSNHMADYAKGLKKLENLGLLYRCTLSRKELSEVMSAPHPDNALNSTQKTPTDTLRYISAIENERRLGAGAPYAIRLHMGAALKLAGNLKWYDCEHGEQTAVPETFGDIVLARKDIATSYHLSVTIDDAIQGITRVTRGNDLLPATHIHRLLQELLELPTPDYHHHKMITDKNSLRLAKRNKSSTLQEMKKSGQNPEDIIQFLGFK